MKPWTRRLMLGFIACAILAGLGRFALIRFASGDLYPAYSSLRAEPDGTKALFDSLYKLPFRSVRRNLDPLERLSGGPQITLLLLGSRGFDHEELHTLARAGTRVVLCLDARASLAIEREEESLKSPFPKPPVEPRKETTNHPPREVADDLGVSAHLIDPLRRDTNRLEVEISGQAEGLPASLLWYGRYYLKPGTNAWKTIYTLKGKPVVLKRDIGLGSVVLMADSYLFSNEGLRNERSPELLLWAIGPGQEVVFDETHLGVERGHGVTVLMREYRLEGFLAGCLLLVSLWVWRNASPLVPAAVSTEKAANDSLEGRTAREGVVHLLRRNITEDDILRLGLEEWAKSHPSNDPAQALRLEEARRVAEAFAASPKPRSLAEAQGAISNILFPKRT